MKANLSPCSSCATPRLHTAPVCPGCGQANQTHVRPAAMVLVGLLGACDDLKSSPDMQAAYGEAVIDTGLLDADEDGYTVAEGDCDDTDATVHPGAEETPGDGVDANCDGEDDT